jgi:dolichol-phosphate mannosyltransferase
MISFFTRLRFVRFGLVGFSGTIVNLAVLYLCQEFLLSKVNPETRRLSYSLAAAIFLATINNFLWNRLWTWADRKGKTTHGFVVQMFQYFTASWLSIALQFIVTKLAAQLTHYMVANVAAIILAAVVTYLLNDVWTFRLRSSVPINARVPCKQSLPSSRTERDEERRHPKSDQVSPR